MIGKVIGVDFQTIATTMLGLVALYLVLVHPTAVTSFIKGTSGAWNQSLVILQGRNPKSVIG